MKAFFNELNILKLIIIIPVMGIIITSSILTNVFINNQKEKHNEEVINLTLEYQENLKSKIQDRINRISKLLETKNKQNFETSKKEIVNIVNIAYNTIQNEYNEHIHQGNTFVFNEIKMQLEKLRFFENNSGYIFIYDLNGKNILLPGRKELQGKNLLNFQDAKGDYTIKKAIDIVKEKQESFHHWYWYKDNTNTMKKKIGYLKGFKPLNIFIGTARYEEDIIDKNKKEAFRLLDSFEYPNGEYIFSMDTKGTTLYHKNSSFIGKKLDSVSKVEYQIIQNILEIAKENPEGGFLEYKPTSYNTSTQLSNKISYVKSIKDFNWVIGTGSYTKELRKKIAAKTLFLENNLNNTVHTILITSAIVTLLLIVIMIFITNALKNILDKYSHELSEKNSSLKELNNSLSSKVKEEVLKNREKDEILYQSSKLAAMGEMLGNIAHQWRQPLSAISTCASGIKLQKEHAILTDELMNQELDTIVSNTQILSQTIDDFRNFYSQKKIKNFFKLELTIEKVLKLISANLMSHEINIIKNIEEIEINSYENELIQAILNILNNAKDKLVENDPNLPRVIFITIFKKDHHLIIEVKDNGGGIKDEIKDKIFEPYFTTKFSSQGTGIGLHMTKEILEKTFKGTITAKNEIYIHHTQRYVGAVFTIKLPIEKVE